MLTLFKLLYDKKIYFQPINLFWFVNVAKKLYDFIYFSGYSAISLAISAISIYFYTTLASVS